MQVNYNIIKLNFRTKMMDILYITLNSIQNGNAHIPNAFEFHNYSEHEKHYV